MTYRARAAPAGASRRCRSRSPTACAARRRCRAASSSRRWRSSRCGACATASCAGRRRRAHPAVTATASPESTTVRVDRVSGRDRRLDGLRALAALAVIFTHVGDWTDAVTGPARDVGAGAQRRRRRVLRDLGRAAVRAVRRLAPRRLARTRTSRTYAIRRILRIYPAYWVALIVILPISPIFGFAARGSGSRFRCSCTRTATAGLFANAGLRQAWTLVIEVSFYAFLPLYAYCIRALGRSVGASRAEIIGAVCAVRRRADVLLVRRRATRRSRSRT